MGEIAMKRNGLCLLALAALGLAMSARAGARHSATIINGAGSTFVSPLVSVWTPALGSAFDYTVQYSPIGSGGGIQAIQNRSVDFGASDAPLTPDQFQRVQLLRADRVGAGRHLDPVQHPGARGAGEHEPPALGARPRRDLHGSDHELERPADQRG
jgi:hypothetical protein